MSAHAHPSHDLNVKKVERVSPTRVRLSLEFPPSVVEAHEKFTAQRYSQAANIPGFRVGKAPLKMVMEKYAGDIKSDVVSHLVEAGLHEACEKNKLSPISRPKIQLDNGGIAAGKAFAFQAEFDVEPVIDLRNYKGVPVKKAALDVTDDEVTQTVESLRERMASLEPLEEQKPTKGCFAVVEVSFEVIGEDTKHSAKTFTVELGQGKLLPELESGLMDMAVGEQRQINAGFPEDYDDKKLAGKKATFECKILELKKKVLPELNDAFAAQLRGAGTLDELRKEIRESLSTSKQKDQQRAQRTEIMDYLVANHSFEVPQSMLEAQFQSLLRWMSEDLKKRGQELSELKKEEIETVKKRAEEMVRSSLLLKEIAIKEQIQLDETKYNQRIDEFAGQLKNSREQAEKLLEEKGMLDRIRDEIMTDQVFDFLIENAKPVASSPAP